MPESRDPRPFGVARPSERCARMLVILAYGAREYLDDVSVGYFPNALEPSHAIFWHKRGLLVVVHSDLECAYPNPK